MALLSDIANGFNTKVRRDRKLKRIANQVRDGTDYTIANEYSIRVGELLSEAVQENTKTLAYMSREVAEEVIPPLLTVDHDMVTEVTNLIQQNMNAMDGIMLGVQTPALDTNRIAGFIEKVASYDTWEQAKWVLGEPLVNYSQAIVDQAVRKNAEVSAKAGAKAYIIRTPERYRTAKGNPVCKWCASLAGKYEYKGNGSNIPHEVFQKHEACRCELTFIRGKHSEDVRTRATWTTGDANAQKRAIAEKQAELERQAQARAVNNHKRAVAVEAIMNQTGYSEKAASIAVNKYKNEIESFGVGYVIDIIHNTNPWTMRYAR